MESDKKKLEISNLEMTKITIENMLKILRKPGRRSKKQQDMIDRYSVVLKNNWFIDYNLKDPS